MKVLLELLVVGLLSAVIVTQPQESADESVLSKADEAQGLPGQMDFEKQVDSANVRFERTKLRHGETIERARLQYIEILEDNLGDLGESENSTRAEAYKQELARVRSLKLHSPKFGYTTYAWEAGQQPVKMIHQRHGFCYLADIGGAFDGGGEVAKVYVGEDGYWYLHGSSGHGFMVIRAIAVKIEG